MKRLLTTLSVATVLLVAAAPAYAIPGFTTGIDLAVNVPVGDLVDGGGMAVGGLVYASFDAIPILKVTGRAGYLFGLEKGGASTSYIPALVGLTWSPIPFAYLASEVGYVWTRVKVDGGGSSDSDGELGGTLGAGVRFLKLDARVSLFFPQFDNGADLMGILLTAGYRF
jgi:hypothetical protein